MIWYSFRFLGIGIPIASQVCMCGLEPKDCFVFLQIPQYSYKCLVVRCAFPSWNLEIVKYSRRFFSILAASTWAFPPWKIRIILYSYKLLSFSLAAQESIRTLEPTDYQMSPYVWGRRWLVGCCFGAARLLAFGSPGQPILDE